MENLYKFREELLQIHTNDIRDASRKPKDNEYEFKDGAIISVPKNAGDVITIAANDFADFLKTSMGVLAKVEEDSPKADVTVGIASDCNVDLGEYASYSGFKVCANADGIKVYGNDERGVAQALYYLEDVMFFEHAPVVEFGDVCKKPMFSPRMVHSGYGLDNYPDEYLARVAHEGRDAILIFTKDVNKTPDGYLDFNELIARAKKYGIDVYAYSYLVSDKHPEDPDAEEYYDNTYGRLFRECPGLAGVTLVGESVEFPSKDPNISAGRKNQTFIDGIPTGKFTPGWWPCYDYPQWIDVVKKTIRKYKPDADIVFWTYNWGGRPKEARVKLLENLPTDITLQATFEMAHQRQYGNIRAHIADYSLSFEGPGGYFSSEAEVAARRGIKLYSMTNTGGLTWDFGMIPYEPMPFQWMRRFEAMRKAHDDWNLSGLMETHHYGFYPSFISKLGKWCFWEPREDMETVLNRILKGFFGEENCKTISEALWNVSEGIKYFTPSEGDQYGAYRVGPAYPFNLYRVVPLPSDPEAMFGNSIMIPAYADLDTNILDAPIGLRVRGELISMEKMYEYINKGVEILEGVKDLNANTAKLLNLVRYMRCCVVTGINSKNWYLLKCKMNNADTKEELAAIYDKLEALLKQEVENAKSAIPYVEADSRLGWEPSMLYIGDSWHIDWKLRHSKYVLEREIPMLRKCLENVD